MDLVVVCYKLSAALPSEEKFGLASQIKRAATSARRTLRRDSEDGMPGTSRDFRPLPAVLCERKRRTSSSPVAWVISPVNPQIQLFWQSTTWRRCCTGCACASWKKQVVRSRLFTPMPKEMFKIFVLERTRFLIAARWSLIAFFTAPSPPVAAEGASSFYFLGC